MSNDYKNSKPAEPEKLTITKDELAQVLKEAMKEGIASGMAMAAMATAPQTPKGPSIPTVVAKYARVNDKGEKVVEDRVLPTGSLETCPECKQRLVGCLGEHRRMAVYPQNRRHGRYFQGCRLNGVLYLSNSLQHVITVPANCDFEYQIANWEANEDELRNGREVEHNSGSIGGGGSAFNPATTGFR
jgi:Icc-related predicted phosphoesterase